MEHCSGGAVGGKGDWGGKKGQAAVTRINMLWRKVKDGGPHRS